MHVKFATCHPNRRYHAKGLCSNCYQNQYRANHPGKQCQYEKARLAKINHSETRRKAYRIRNRKSWIKRKFGLTQEQHDAILLKQGFVCAICGEKFSQRFPAVDHDHLTGKIRGLLHTKCNAAIGLLNDDPVLLEKAASYLRSHT